MKFTAAMMLAASATLATAQITVDANGVIKCPKALAGSFCVGESLLTKTIATCDANGIGKRGLCSEFLAEKPPYGSNDALCYQSSDVSGDAACEFPPTNRAEHSQTLLTCNSATNLESDGSGVKGGIVYENSGTPRLTLSADPSQPKNTASTVSDDWKALPTSSPCPLEPVGTEVPGAPGVPATSEPAWPSVDPVPSVSGPVEPIPTGGPMMPPVSGTPEQPLPSDGPLQPPPVESVPPVGGGNGGNDTFTVPTVSSTETPAVQPPAPTASIPVVPVSAAVMEQTGAVMMVVGLAVACLL
ncbi:hypothetical protein RB601_009790 [Gaeumannomyces tritici]